MNFPNATETLWNCEDVIMEQVRARGDYFAMNSRNMKLRDFQLVGNYSFDGVKNMEIHNARLLSKDAFWNSENVTVYDSFYFRGISGLECQEPDSDQLYGRKSAGNVLYRQSCHEKLQTAEYHPCIRVFYCGCRN